MPTKNKPTPPTPAQRAIIQRVNKAHPVTVGATRAEINGLIEQVAYLLRRSPYPPEARINQDRRAYLQELRDLLKATPAD